MKKLLIVLAIGFVQTALYIVGFSVIARSQTVYKINTSPAVNMKLSGSSTLHKWDMNSHEVAGNAQFEFNPANAGQLTSIKSLSFVLLVSNLKSNDKGLDKNAYKALKTGQYKNISYQLTAANIQPSKENKFLVKTKGNLNIAGVTREISMDVYCVLNKDETITCSGTKHLKMTDYKVKPPTFMLGAMKTGDDITLDFTMVYNK